MFEIEVVEQIDASFEDGHPLHGSRIKFRSGSLAWGNEMQELWSEDVRKALLAVIVEWDVAVKGEAVPLTREGLETLPAWAPVAIWEAWVKGMMVPPTASPIASSNGATSGV